jgi:hypothetical protein
VPSCDPIEAVLQIDRFLAYWQRRSAWQSRRSGNGGVKNRLRIKTAVLRAPEGRRAALMIGPPVETMVACSLRRLS